MGFLKALFGGQEESAEEKEARQQTRNFNILKHDGLRALSMHQADYAAKCFEQALGIQSDDEAETGLAQAYLMSGRTQEACDTLEQLTARIPNNPNLWLALAQTEFQLKNYEKAIEAGSHADGSEELQAEVHLLNGQAYAAMGRFIEAIVALTQAVQKAPESDRAYLKRAEVLKEMGQLAEAEKDTDYLLEHFGDSEESLMMKGQLLQLQNRPEEAITYYNKVKDLNPFHRPVYIALSETYDANRQADRSLQVLEEGIELVPDFAEAYKERGRIRLQLNDKQGAMDDLKKALELAPEEGKTLDGNYTNVEQEMNEQYRAQNPFQF
ncbi:MAG: tetratricopeptide repeat protein [Clostridium sp.]|nr:tetratricopeptide repeat protein [Clostridium sp.]